MKIVNNANALVLQLEVTGATSGNTITFKEGLTKAAHTHILPAIRHAIFEGTPCYVRLRAAEESNTQLVSYPLIGIVSGKINFVAPSTTGLLLGIIT